MNRSSLGVASSLPACSSAGTVRPLVNRILAVGPVRLLTVAIVGSAPLGLSLSHSGTGAGPLLVAGASGEGAALDARDGMFD